MANQLNQTYPITLGDGGTNATSKSDAIDNLVSGATITSATVAGTDKVLIQDGDDSDNLKTVTAQSIADLGATTVNDSTFRIENNADDTKKIAFDASNIAASTTRTITMADQAVDLTPTTGTFQGSDAGLTDIAGLAVTDGNFIVGDGANWVAESGSTARTSLGLGSIATQNANNVTISGGSVTGITDITVEDGGTGASSHTAYAVLCGGTTSTGAVQSVASVGSSGQVLTSNGAGSLPTFQDASGGLTQAEATAITLVFGR